MDSLEDCWRPDVFNIVRGCTVDVYKLDWQEVVEAIWDSTFSLTQFAEKFGRGIQIYLEIHRLECVDPAVFTASVYRDMCDAVRTGLVKDSASFPTALFEIVAFRADLEVEYTFWSVAARTEAA